MTTKLIELEDDGLYTAEIGAWGEEKYKLVSIYATIFATSMKGKWDCRVYIDLFAGAGRARIENTNRIIPASPLLALDINNKFDIYIFCEEDGEKIRALRERLSKAYPQVDTRYLQGDTNKLINQLLQEIPQHQKGFKVLCFCFADPYKLKNLSFETIRLLSKRFVDFLVLIPTHMDANRNESNYVKETNKTIDRFLGNSNWRDKWKKAKLRGEAFGDFVANCFGKQMATLNYLYSGIQDTKLVRADKNLPLYRLAFFSRHKRGEEFWEEAKKYSQDQLSLF